jgi:hypothetical protein
VKQKPAGEKRFRITWEEIDTTKAGSEPPVTKRK